MVSSQTHRKHDFWFGISGFKCKILNIIVHKSCAYALGKKTTTFSFQTRTSVELLLQLALVYARIEEL